MNNLLRNSSRIQLELKALRAVLCAIASASLCFSCAVGEGKSGSSQGKLGDNDREVVAVSSRDLSRVTECRITRARAKNKADVYVVLPAAKKDYIAVSLYAYNTYEFKEDVPLAGGFESFVVLLKQGVSDLAAAVTGKSSATDSEGKPTLSFDFVCAEVLCTVAFSSHREEWLAGIETSQSLRKALDLIESRMGKDYQIWNEPGPDKDMVFFNSPATKFQPGSLR